MKKLLFLTTIILTYIMFSSNILAASMSVSASSTTINVQDVLKREQQHMNMAAH